MTTQAITALLIESATNHGTRDGLAKRALSGGWRNHTTYAPTLLGDDSLLSKFARGTGVDTFRVVRAQFDAALAAYNSAYHTARDGQ